MINDDHFTAFGATLNLPGLYSLPIPVDSIGCVKILPMDLGSQDRWMLISHSGKVLAYGIFDPASPSEKVNWVIPDTK